MVSTSCRVVAFIAVVAAGGIPASAQDVRPFDSGIVVGSDWLQATALPLRRNALQSISAFASVRHESWAADAGWLRVARNLSTVQGGTISIGPLVQWKRLLLVPAVGGFAGQAQASRDSSGYDWIAQPCPACTSGSSGHEARFTKSSGASFGGSISLTLEIPLYRALGARAVVQQWYFSGAPLDGDRARTVLGAGGSLRIGR